MAARGTKPTAPLWKRELDVIPLQEVVAIATRAHHEMRSYPEFWRLIAISARLVGGFQQSLQDMAAPTITPEDTLREAGISSRRLARYQRRMSALLAGREGGA
jgi:hypothetical protein